MNSGGGQLVGLSHTIAVGLLPYFYDTGIFIHWLIREDLMRQRGAQARANGDIDMIRWFN